VFLTIYFKTHIFFFEDFVVLFKFRIKDQNVMLLIVIMLITSLVLVIFGYKYCALSDEKNETGALIDYTANLSEHILTIVIGILIFFALMSFIYFFLDWTTGNFNQLFNWTGSV